MRKKNNIYSPYELIVEDQETKLKCHHPDLIFRSNLEYGSTVVIDLGNGQNLKIWIQGELSANEDEREKLKISVQLKPEV